MSLAVGIVAGVVTVATAVFVAALFVWGAVKDGEEDAAVRARIARNRLGGAVRSGGRRAAPAREQSRRRGSSTRRSGR